MAAIAPYTAASFKDYLHARLSHTANALGWTVINGDYDEILKSTLIGLNVDAVTGFATNADLKKLRSVGRYFLWEAVAEATAGDYNFSADGGSYSREQMHEHALVMLAQAESEAAVYGVVDLYAVQSGSVTYHRDPYRDYDDELSAQIDLVSS